MIRVVIVGQGYVGLPLSITALEAGCKVTGVDSDSRKISRIEEGNSPVPETERETILEHVSSGMYKPTSSYTELGEFDFAVITVPTPLKDGKPDLDYIRSASHSLAPFLAKNSTVILESTTYPGTTETILAPILSSESGLTAGEDFFLGYSPERIDPGNTEWNLKNTPKVVSGVNDASLDKVKAFYESLGIPVVPVSNTRIGEMTKLLENTFRHVNIALINELSTVARELNVDLWEAIEAASTKPFGFMRFVPGPGVGGHCLPVDPSYLSWAVAQKTGTNLRFVSLANEVNEQMPAFIVSRVSELLSRAGKTLETSRIAILGVSYKKGSQDTRESPSIKIAGLLEEMGASAFAIDPNVPDHLWPTSLKKLPLGPRETFDLSILVTDHPEFLQSWVLDSSDIVLDTRNFLRGANVANL